MTRHDELAALSAQGHALLAALDVLTIEEILQVQADAQVLTLDEIEALYEEVLGYEFEEAVR